ncbi:MAG: hypothetical protein GTO02_08285, partial [Candidatus Dadabacteria bacterium]|nr:hypothetical protein [Candidatus Dadabacteria bacterium]
MKIDPNFDEGYVLLAHIQFGQNKLREAESSLKKAELLGTDDPWLHLNWASLNIARGEYEAAIDRWNYVLQNYTGDEFAISKAYSFMLD